MKNRYLSLEHAFYMVALAIAMTLRLLSLGKQPLSDFEAGWALQALQVSKGGPILIGANPAYVHITAILFFIFGSSNFLARILPALAGCALVLAPWLLRERIGRTAAILLAFGLALDPGFVGISHLAGGPMPAIAIASLACLLWLKGKKATAGIFCGVALLSGPSIWLGLFGFGLACIAVFVIFKKVNSKAKVNQIDSEDQTPLPGKNKWSNWRDWKVSTTWCVGTIILLGSLGFLSLSGLSAFVQSFAVFLRGWWTPSELPIWKPIIAMLAYEIAALGFGIASIVRGIRSRDPGILLFAAWVFISISLALVYPGKMTSDISWAILPLWILAAMELSKHTDLNICNRWELAGTIILIEALLIFTWLDFASLSNMDLNLQTARMRIYLLLAVVLLVGLCLLLIASGWSKNLARLGGVWAAVIMLILFSIAMSTGTAGMREPPTMDLWQVEPQTSRVDVLQKVAQEISEINSGFKDQLSLTILNIDSAALDWLFRDWSATKVNGLAPDSAPELIISFTDQLNLTADYRGEALPLYETIEWNQATASNWLKWFIYRKMPTSHQDIIFWVRSDLMLDNQGSPESQ